LESAFVIVASPLLMRFLPSTAWKLDPSCLPEKTASTLVDWTPAAGRLKGRWTQVAENATVACTCEQIDALHVNVEIP